MAVISKIRKQSTLLLVVVGLAMVLFIVGDFLTSNSSFFSSNDTTVAEINGQAIDAKDYNILVQNIIQTQYGGNEAAKEQARMQAWNQLINDLVFQPLYSDLGISVTDEEIIDIIKNNPNDPTLRRYFSDQQGNVIENFRDPMTGGLDGQKVLSYIKDQVYSGVAEAEQAKESFTGFRESWRESLKSSKLSTLLSKGYYVTSLEAGDVYVEKNKKIDLSYVVQLYDAIPDSTVSVSDADLQSYYNEHKGEERFKQDETTRSIEYVVFDVVPSEADAENTKNALEELKPAFEKTDEDTLFVTENADTPGNINYYQPGDFPYGVDSVIFNAEVGTVVGPYRNGDAYNLAKVLGSRFAPDSAKARHILLPINGADTAAVMATADSIKAVIKAEDNFGLMAMQYSMDPGSKEKGGELGWFTDGRMVPVFNDACFNGKVGDMPVVVSPYGVHIIEVQDQTEAIEKLKVAVVDTKVEPSEDTYSSVFNDAQNFYINNNKAEAFRENGEAYGIRTAPNIRLSDKQLGGFENPRQIITWVYNNEVGTVSEPFAMDNQFVVALLTEVKEKGVLPLESVKDEVELEVLKEKKAEQIKTKMSGVTDLNELAQKFDSRVQKVSGLTFNDFQVRGLGNEPKVQGVAYTLEVGQVSVPVDGKRGVYVIRVDNKTEVPSDAIPIQAEKQQLEQQKASSVQYQLELVMRDKAGIQDYRAKFY